MRSRLLLVAALALGVSWSAAPAWAAPEANIEHAQVAKDGGVQILFGVSELPAGTAPDLDSIAVTVDGETAEATAKPLSAGTIERTTVLALDTSLSMRPGSKFVEAKAAAQAFLASAPADVKVGLVTFDGDVRTVAEPSTDHQALSATIDDLELSLGTKLYAAITDAIALAGEDGARSVLVLSDGANADKATPIETTIGAADDAGVKVDVVALAQSPKDRALLTQIADAANGAVIPAGDPEALRALFTAEAEALSQQVLVEFVKPGGAPDEATIEASIVAGGETYSDSALFNLASSTPEAKAEARGPQQVRTPAPLVDNRGLLLGGLALAVGLAGLLAIVLVGAKPQRSLTKKQMAHYSVDPRAASAAIQRVHAPAPSPGVRESALAVADTLVRKGDFETTLSQRISAAGLTLTPAEWLLMHVGVAVLGGLVGMVLGGTVPMVLLMVLGLVLPWVFLGFKRSRRLAVFNGQLAETLQLISGGLGAGLSLPQAVDTVVREGAEPMAGEMRRALIEQRLGVDIEDALDGVADRMTSDDFRWVVIAMRIQREVGGNLAELLTTVAATLREREYLRRQVKTLSAEGRLSAWILGALPIGMTLYLALSRPEYLRPMYTELLGWVMSFSAVTLLLFGAFVMSKLVKVEV